MSKILIGHAGTGGAELNNFIKLKELGLDCVEIEFTYFVWMSKEQALKIKELNKKLGLKLSIHAPYFINLNSLEKQKVRASEQRILKCLEIGTYLGADYVVFHAGFYQKSSKEETYNKIKQEIIKIQKEAKEKDFTPKLAPETTGKESQFGNLDELLQLVRETNCSLCLDFSHLKARYNGEIDYEDILEKIKKAGLKNVHCHFSGIEYTSKGERRHILTSENYIKELYSHINNSKLNIAFTIINESPNTLGDAIKMKKLLE